MRGELRNAAEPELATLDLSLRTKVCRCNKLLMFQPDSVWAAKELHGTYKRQDNHQRRSYKARPGPKAMRAIMLHVPIKMMDAVH